MSDKTYGRGYQDGYRLAMMEAASVANELYRNHTLLDGEEGLLRRCQEAEQVFLKDAEKHV